MRPIMGPECALTVRERRADSMGPCSGLASSSRVHCSCVWAVVLPKRRRQREGRRSCDGTPESSSSALGAPMRRPSPAASTPLSSGPRASLAVLVRALSRVETWTPDLTFLITPVDTLPCSESTHRALRRALADHVLASTPRFSGRGGHPVLLRAGLLEPYLEGPLEACRPLREVLAGTGAQRTCVDVADPGVVSDVDTPADACALGLRLPALQHSAWKRPRDDMVTLAMRDHLAASVLRARGADRGLHVLLLFGRRQHSG